MMLNLTQHPATKEQIEQGVVDLGDDDRETLQKLLTFESLPDAGEIHNRAAKIAALASAAGAKKAMIGGAPFLMSALEAALKNRGIMPCYAFSARISIEVEEDGEVHKTSVFKHLGFVQPIVL